MNKEHHHRRINTDKLLKTLEHAFTPNRHNASHLADLLIHFSKRRNEQLTTLQKLSLHLFHSERAYDLRDAAEAPDGKVLAAYFELFDRLFFFGSLNGLCAITRSPRISSKNDFDGRTFYKENMGENNTPGAVFRGDLICDIIISTQDLPSRYERLRRYIGSLLHQMLHAFFQLWTCPRPHCFDKVYTNGEHRHWRIWQEVAFALEDAARDPSLLNLDLYLNRERLWLRSWSS